MIRGLPMPVDIHLKHTPIYQREQFDKGGIGRIYWNYRDKLALSCMGKRDARVVDVGCGEGITLEKAGRLFPEKCFIGIDGLKENLLICRNHHLKVAAGDVYQLPFEDDVFDCIFFLEVIEHLTEPEKALTEMHRILKPQGRMVMIFPNDTMFKISRLLTLKLKEAFYDPGHLRQWTPGDMKIYLKRYGFRILKQKNIPFFIWHLSLHHLIVCEKELIG
jgi:ubiquinone/menaquinone biosynthesis C-methylase UbiE